MKGRVAARSTPSAVSSARGSRFGAERQRNRELVAAEAGDHRIRAKLVGQCAGDAFEQAVAGLIAMLVVDRLEAVDLEGDDGEIVIARRGLARHFRGAVGEALAVVEAGDRVGAGKHGGALLLLRAHLRFVLEIDVAAPAEQDQRDVQGQGGAGDAHFGAEVAGDPQVLKEGAAVPDEQDHGGDQHDQHHRIALRIFKTRARRCRYDWYIHTGHERGGTAGTLNKFLSKTEIIAGERYYRSLAVRQAV